MKINSIKPGSSTVLILNYLGMRKRNRKEWVTFKEIANFFPHKFTSTTKKTGNLSTSLVRLVESNFIVKKQIKDLDYYSITPLGSVVPFHVASNAKKKEKGLDYE